MTTTEAHTMATDAIDAARDAGAEIADEARSRAEQVRGAIEGAADHVPELIEGARLGAAQTNTRFQTLPAPTLHVLVAASIGLAIGLYVAGAPRLVTLAALVPALFAGWAMAVRPESTAGGAR